MLHYMKLNPEPFRKISEGIKTIELRLYDEKRQKIRAGNFIEFSDINNPEDKITVKVTAFHCYENFEELYKSLPMTKCGYENEADAEASDMEKFYSREKQAEYGVVGIELRKTELQKFVDAQNNGYMLAAKYDQAYEELKKGLKITHWMWYVFPQINGLGMSDVTKYFSINSLEEAKDYFNHPVLGARLMNASEVLLDLDNDDPVTIFGYVDSYKLCSCMTLFMKAAPEEKVFRQVIDKFFNGREDEKTLEILNELNADNQ